MSKRQYRVRNWKKYNEALVQRGSITFWFDEKVIEQWYSMTQSNKRGRPEYYSDFAIECALLLKTVFKLPYRATEGLIKSLIERMELPLETPDYSTLCIRQKTLGIKVCPKKIEPSKGLEIVVDSTGLKVFGEGEWKVRIHGKTKKRTWRKIHIGLNSETQEIESCVLTKSGIEDCQGLPLVLKEINGKISKLIGDGAYDRFSCYELGEQYQCEVVFPPQRNARTSKERPRNKKKASQEAVLKRDEVIKEVRALGRSEWKKKRGYHRRSLGETVMYRLKRMLGNRLSSRLITQQEIELKLKCIALNKMTQLGMPQAMAI